MKSALILTALRHIHAPAQKGVLEALQKQSRVLGLGPRPFEHLGLGLGAPQSSSSFCSSASSPPSSSLILQAERYNSAAARGLSTGTAAVQGNQSVSIDLASHVLEQSSVLALREELQLLSEGNTMISFSEFARLASLAGCSRTDEEAMELCSHLQKACIVLRHRDSVYLRPEEIAQAVMMMMPNNKEDAERTLAQLEQELGELEKVHQDIERAAHSRTNAMLTLGLVVLCVQFIAFLYLTWWELSWDVMEPIGYMISLFYSICAYIYFLGTKGSQFDLGPFKEFWSKRFQNNKKAQMAFDQERWDFLMKQRDRMRKHLGISHQVMRALIKH